MTLHDRTTKSLLHLHKKKKPPSISAQFQVGDWCCTHFSMHSHLMRTDLPSYLGCSNLKNKMFILEFFWDRLCYFIKVRLQLEIIRMLQNVLVLCAISLILVCISSATVKGYVYSTLHHPKKTLKARNGVCCAGWKNFHTGWIRICIAFRPKRTLFLRK